MDDIFSHVREGNAFQVRIWLDNTENDLNQGYVSYDMDYSVNRIYINNPK